MSSISERKVNINHQSLGLHQAASDIIYTNILFIINGMKGIGASMQKMNIKFTLKLH